jgi:dual specificity phosphatase 12
MSISDVGCTEEERSLFKPVVLNNCDQILPFLYLGGVDAVADTQCVVDQGIRAVVCCLRDLEYPEKDFRKEDIEYYRVDVEDISREPIEMFFPEATEFIHSWVSREQPVLVHCRAGVSRSASVVMAYLMTFQGFTLHDAFFLVRSRRSCVSPNIGFMEKLCDYEEAQQETDTTVDINKYISWYTSEGRAAVPDLDPE